MLLYVLLALLFANIVKGTKVTQDDNLDQPEEPTCVVGILDVIHTLKDGEKVEQRCDEYTCVNGTVEKNIYPCDTPINYFENNICHQWSENSCCCEVVGCEDVHGVVQPKGSVYQVSQPDPNNPDCGDFCPCLGWFHPCSNNCSQPLSIK